MTTNITIAAQVAHPSIPFVTKGTMTAETEGLLDRISHGEPVAQVYEGENRPWWDFVDDNRVYGTISGDLFQALVRLNTSIA